MTSTNRNGMRYFPSLADLKATGNLKMLDEQQLTDILEDTTITISGKLIEKLTKPFSQAAQELVKTSTIYGKAAVSVSIGKKPQAQFVLKVTPL